MNLILAEPGEIQDDRSLVLRGERLQHLRGVLVSVVGDSLRVGVINGGLGRGEIIAINADQARLRVELTAGPPKPLPVTVVLALPRPKMLRRLLRAVAELGVKDLHLIHSFRVEKSYWQSPLLAPDRLREYLLAGLSQAGDTVLPEVQLHRRFKPFVEDQLPSIRQERTVLLADPGASVPYPSVPPSPAVVVIGPEGGFIPFEVDLLCAHGADPVGLGERILRVETALQAALGRHLEAPLQS